MKNYNAKTAFAQRGMTLVELTVVLLILIGLAGLLLPYVGGFLETTKTAGAADSLAELNKAVDRHEIQFMGYPDDFDTLHDGTGVIGWLPGGAATTAQLAAVDLTAAANANLVTALVAADIDDLRPMQATAPDVGNFNATFAGSLDEAAISTTAGAGNTTNLVRLTEAAVDTVVRQGMGLEVEDEDMDGTAGNEENYYMVFGVGQNTQMTGRTIKEAPVYFSAGGDNPAKAYNRFLAVFKVPVDGSRATFIGTTTPDLQAQSQVAANFFENTDDDD